jgi:hypothetical protein
MSLVEAMHTLDWREMEILLEELPPAWSPTDENIARLVDRDDFHLNGVYAGWTADPDAPDPGPRPTPPPVPVLDPVAVRPPDLTAELAERNAAYLASLQTPSPTPQATQDAALDALFASLGG